MTWDADSWAPVFVLRVGGAAGPAHGPVHHWRRPQLLGGLRGAMPAASRMVIEFTPRAR
ncbi:hypothetical protein AB0N87_34755 [Streptomyces sp. NPDC093228]|uniref:hypothetical protein n=1 Tax=Streptomyces sp. NPDC093228 TaxID=3155070 RepID=UPI00342D8ED3